MKFIQNVMVATLLASAAMCANAETTNRTLYLEATSNAPRDDARGRIIIGVIDQWNPKSAYGREVVLDIDFWKLQCLGPFTTQQSVLFYTLYINDQRVLSFNTKCRYAIEGGLGGDFGTGLIFVDNDEWEAFIVDPVNDPIHAKVHVESHLYAPVDHQSPPTSGENYKILEGWLTD